MACASARSSWSGRVVAARSSRVRWTVVIGMPSWLVVSWASREREVCRRIPGTAVAAARGGHIDALLVGRQQLPMGRRAAMAEDGARPAGQHRRQPMALRPQHGVAECVHPVMDAMQPPRAHRVLHGPRPIPTARSCAPDSTPHCRSAAFASPQPRGWPARTHYPCVSAATPRACQATRDSGHRKRNDSASARAPPAHGARYRRAREPLLRKPTSSRSGAISPRRCRGRAATR